ncbi:premnaspirodiene oxygenase-like [Musa acuminata AAA Group]|uniref:premnaspirodiene oxygenase-like n=1 Tax=Musa acuminata AAA Group TaxID=214697 RepID=UPI0031E0F7E8
MEHLLLASVPMVVSTMLFLIIFIKKGFSKSKVQYPRPPPGPWRLPIIGCMHHLASRLSFRVFRHLSLTYGPLMLVRIGQVDFAVASSREAAREILKNQDPNFAARPEVVVGDIVFYGCSDVIFSPYGPYWKQLRYICFMELLRTKRVRSFASIREEETLNVIRDISTATQPINMREKLFRMSNAIISRAAIGPRSKHQETFILVAREVIDVLGELYAVDMFPSLKLLHVLSGAKFKLQRIRRRLDKIFDDIIKEHEVKANMNKGRQVAEVEEDIVDALLRLKDESELQVPMTMDGIKAVILDMLVGGTENSSIVIEWAMSELMRNPKILEKAQKEVMEELKGKNRIQETDVVELNYLKSIVKETLRLHPPVRLIPRMCRKTCEVLGYEIEAGTPVLVNAWAINRDPQYWEEAESFRPERFEGKSIDFKGGNFEYLPFGAGRRICPGLGFGLATIHLSLAQLLLYFDWKLPDGRKSEELDMSETLGVTVTRKTELKLSATPRIPIPSTV